MSDRPLDSLPRDDDRARSGIPFDVGMAMVGFVLCLLYALLFSRLVYDSVLEHVFVPASLPRYMGRPHTHNSIEWLWLLSGLVLGWGGALVSAAYLARRWLRR